jgi:hypothetical protein
MGWRDAASGQHWLTSTGCPPGHGEPSRAHELGGTLQTVQQHSRGWLLLLPLGVAFAASAVFDFIEALYHRPQASTDTLPVRRSIR